MQMAAAISSKKDVEARLLKMPGVTAVDVGYKYVDGKPTNELAIRIHVAKKKKQVSEKEKIPATIDGIKTDVLEEVYVPFQFSNKMAIDANLQSDTVHYRPIKGGISIGPDRSVGGYVYAGTLGCMVKDNGSSAKMMLSNFHVMCIDSGWHVGDKQNQPSLIDSGTHADTVGTIARAVLSGHVDGALANINSGISSECTIVDIGNVNGTNVAVLNMAVRKRGRTTLLTYGFVDGLAASVNIDYGNGIGVRTLTNQITIRPDTTRNPMFSDHGDSGSAIVDGNNNVVGLLFAGSATRTIANHITDVENELNVKVCKFVPKPIKEIVKDKLEIKEHKIEAKELKNELKERKIEKIEKIEIKERKIEKIEHKELIIDNKPIIDHNPKNIVEVDPNGPIINPGPTSSGDLEQRIQQLEQAIGQLSAFIAAGLRPDLSQGALSNEDDYSG